MRLLAVVVVAVFTSVSSAGGPPTDLSGHVSSASGERIEGATIVVSGGADLIVVESDERGRFQVALERGRYTVVAYAAVGSSRPVQLTVGGRDVFGLELTVSDSAAEVIRVRRHYTIDLVNGPRTSRIVGPSLGARVVAHARRDSKSEIDRVALEPYLCSGKGGGKYGNLCGGVSLSMPVDRAWTLTPVAMSEAPSRPEHKPTGSAFVQKRLGGLGPVGFGSRAVVFVDEKDRVGTRAYVSATAGKVIGDFVLIKGTAMAGTGLREEAEPAVALSLEASAMIGIYEPFCGWLMLQADVDGTNSALTIGGEWGMGRWSLFGQLSIARDTDIAATLEPRRSGLMIGFVRGFDG